MGVLDSLKKMDGTKIALGVSVPQNLASSAENARLREENKRLLDEIREHEEEMEMWRDRFFSQELAKSLDAKIKKTSASSNKRRK